MKVAIYSPRIYTKGGMERVMLVLLKRSKHNFTLFTHYFNPTSTFEEFRNYDIVTLGNYDAKSLADWAVMAFKIISAKIDLKNFDAFIVNGGSLFNECIIFRNHDVPSICYLHTSNRFVHDEAIRKHVLGTKYRGLLRRGIYLLFTKLYPMLERRAYAYFDLILANSEHVKRRFLNLGLVKNSIVLHPGVDTKLFYPTWRFEHYFLSVGRINEWKRHELAIESFKIFSRVNEDFKLIIAGNLVNKDAYYFKKLKRLARDCQNIIFLTSLSDHNLLRLYQKAYAVLFTAINEDWGIVPLEAMACGKPVIAVNEGGPRESIIDGKTGFLVDARPEKFAEKLLVFANNPELVEVMGKEARKRALQYDWSSFVSKFDKYIEMVANKSLPGRVNEL